MNSLSTNDSSNNYKNENLITRRIGRCCSFCRRQGHNIVNCNSDRLLEFEVICADVVKNIHTKIEFKNWLKENYNNELLLIKAFAIKKSRVSTNDISIYMDLITEYIFTNYKNNWTFEEEENQIENDLLNLLLHIRNNYSIEPLQDQLIYQNMERMLLLELSIAYLTNVNNNDNSNDNSYSRKNVMDCTFHINIDENLNEINTCSICYDNKELKNFVTLDCNHEFCESCIIKTLQTNSNIQPCCALCRRKVINIKTRTIESNAKIIESL